MQVFKKIPNNDNIVEVKSINILSFVNSSIVATTSVPNIIKISNHNEMSVLFCVTKY